jgi:ribosome-binding protein aMBF1 (putative translation factor)
VATKKNNIIANRSNKTVSQSVKADSIKKNNMVITILHKEFISKRATIKKIEKKINITTSKKIVDDQNYKYIGFR